MWAEASEGARIEVPVQRTAARPSGLGIPRVFVAREVRRALGPYVVARRRIPSTPGELRAILRAEALPPSPVPVGPVAPPAPMDVAGRAALGISEREVEAREATVTLESLRIGWRRRGRELLARVFGVRYVTQRVVLSLATDAERAVVRVDRTALDLLGCDSGDRVVLTAPTRRAGGMVASSVTTQVFEIPQHELEERERRELSAEGHDALYRSFRTELGLEFDVPRVFVPGDVRDELGVDHGDTVLVRREIPSLFGRSFREFGLLVLLSGLAVAQLPIPVEQGWGAVVALVLLANALGVFFTGASIRSRVRSSWRSTGRSTARRGVTSSDTVWYAGYGSNLLPQRLLCYLEGGQVEGMTVANPGARNRLPFSDHEVGMVPGRLRFAGSFTSWESRDGGAGAAMLQLRPGGPPDVHAVAYRITVEQLVDVLLQECGFDPQDLDSVDTRYAVQRQVIEYLQDLSTGGPRRVLRRGSGIPTVRPVALGDAVYGRLAGLPLHKEDGTVRTVHVLAPVDDHASNPPGDAYRSTMRAGLIGTVGLSPDAADAYLEPRIREAEEGSS